MLTRSVARKSFTRQTIRLGAALAVLASTPTVISTLDARQTATYQELRRFSAPFRGYDAPLVAAPGGTLYGVFMEGGSRNGGGIYALTPDGAGGFTFAMKHEFLGPEGYGPTGLMLASDGDFYGTTRAQYASSGGTVFKMTSAGTVTVVFALNGIGTPLGGVTEGRDGRLYGTLDTGFPAFQGSIFVVDKDGQNFETLYAFSGPDGARPRSALVQGVSPDDAFYGTTPEGGAAGAGTVFSIAADGTFTQLHSLDGAADGNAPGGLTRGPGGAFYGVTGFGGADGNGTIFTVGTTVGSFATIHSIGFSEGRFPNGVLGVGPDDRLYGTTSGFFTGTVFAVTTAGDFSNLHTFNGADGMFTTTGLTAGADGLMHGFTSSGGAHNVGVVFNVDTAGAFTKTLDFPNTGGAHSYGGLAEAGGGLLFGGVGHGGEKNLGMLFRLDPAGPFSVVHDFLGPEGGRPFTGLTTGPDGNLYGTTLSGGPGLVPPHFETGFGTVFRQSPLGTYTMLHAFNGTTDGSGPIAPPTFASDGNLYGTASTGQFGVSENGTVYKIDPAGTFTTLHVFTGTDGSSPSRGALVEGHDGQMYGTTLAGGAHGFGTAYKIDSAGSLTTLHDFDGAEGASPSGLTLQSDGSFHGTTIAGGASGLGTLFVMTPGGTVTTLHHFTGPTGTQPSTPPIEGGDGKSYGVTTGGGLQPGGFLGAGTAYRWAQATGLETLHTFHNFDGTLQSPIGPLLQASDNKLYGTTFGPAGGVFSLAVGLNNRRPSAVSQSLSTSAPIPITLTGSDPEGDPLTFAVVDQPDHGTLSGTAPNLTYTPDAGYSGPDVFRFRASDGIVSSGVAAVAITVTTSGTPTTTTLQVSAATLGLLQPITLTASVAPVPPGTGVPTGSVEFFSGTTLLGTVALTGGTASLTTNGLPPGANALSARYLGSGSFAGSVSAAVTVTVQAPAASSFTFLFPLTNPQVFGTPISVAAAVIPLGGGVSPTGTVEFYEGTTLMATATLSGSVATASWTPGGTSGVRLLFARYLGDASFAPSTSAPALITLYVGAAPATTTTTLAAAPSPSTLGQQVTFTATVSNPAPVGSLVAFFADGTLLGTAPIAIVGGARQAVLTTSSLPVGVHVVSASYISAPGVAASNSNLLVHIVNP